MSTSAPQPQAQENEISYEHALAHQDDFDQVGDQAPPMPAPRQRPGQQEARQQVEPQESPTPSENDAAAEEAREAIDILAPHYEARQWTFGQGSNAMTYVQRELSVIAKTQWFSLVGEILDKAIGGENSLSLNALLSPPENVRPGSTLRMQDFQDADTFVHAIGKLLVFAPEFFEKSICIWLAVPDYEWPIARALMRLSPELGGLNDDDAEEIIATFIDQNYKSLSTFFRDRFSHLRDRWNARAKDHQSRSPRR